MEPCSRRLSGKLGCAQRLLAGPGGGAVPLVARVVLCMAEPTAFVADCAGAALLRAAGVDVALLRDADCARLARAPNAHLMGSESV